MNLCIDQGNSSTKALIFNQSDLIDEFCFGNFGNQEITDLFEKFPIKQSIISSVTTENVGVKNLLHKKSQYFIELNHTTSLPIQNLYKTPETLGKDRLAAVVGASYLNPGSNSLVIDAGTAITYDFINSDNQYLGGNIAPGLDLRLRSLHEFTKRLPLVSANSESLFLGNDTNSALESGALYGIVFEIEGYINTLKIKYPQLSVFLTGGSTFYFATKLKKPIFAEKNLVSIGLNRILQYNVQK